MIGDLMYIELKTGYSDDGPAWIGYVKTSKTKRTIYFNDHAFQKSISNYSNYIDIESGEEYWISGLKKKESNRHWEGRGKVMIDHKAVNEYLTLIGEKELPLNLFEVIELEDRFPVERVNELLNEKEDRIGLVPSVTNDNFYG
ncbi:MAG: mannose-1-phosphate guanylyltransferase [[Ruminococcus] gnavus]|nr:mannose-1-phosphate guanylyltransferase [Mediterraneibacter gnavus]